MVILQNHAVHLWVLPFERKMNSLQLAKTVLRRYLSDDQIIFEITAHGKPYLKHEPLQFNFSHSGDYFVMGVTQSMPIGVDIERERNTRDFLEIAQRFFAASEYNALRQLPVAAQQSAFYRCWVLKEAYIKTTGIGLSLGLNNFEVDFSEGVLVRSHDHDRYTLRFIALDLPGYSCAIGLKGHWTGEVHLQLS